MNVSIVNRDTFYEASLVLQIEEVFIEKDWFVTKLIKDTCSFKYTERFKLIFCGGTALSKAHNAIARFSEDVDFRIHGVSKYSRNELSLWRKSLVEYLRNHGWNILDENIKSRDKNTCIEIQIDYPTLYSHHRALRPRLKVEFKARNLELEPSICQVSSFINSVSKQEPEISAIACMSIIENAADKIAALAWRVPARQAQKERAQDPNMVRHIHDLAKLLPIIEDKATLLSCLKASMRADPKQGSFKDEELINQIKISTEILKSSELYKEEYSVFVESMVYDSREYWPSFEQGIAEIELVLKHFMSQ
jgi:predicted nucleotidyltransferase component of viral defense system